MNLRELQKKFGRNIGLNLNVVRRYAKQLFCALKHLQVVVNETRNKLKLCDFGNAMFAGKNEITPYLYLACHKIIQLIRLKRSSTKGGTSHVCHVGTKLGGVKVRHGHGWIRTLTKRKTKLYAGKILFPGRYNNDMLRLHMELKGPFPKKMLRKGAFTYQHFDQDLNFLGTDEDPVTKKAIRKLIVNVKAKEFSSIISGYRGEQLKTLALL
ncbi:hypothetical protein T459_16338 [Capsicum annuum]|uniref:Protein kinase domain-containing protein n=1 Tax=Capsicum annuum TaxID=4072 RepID=A0A2G2Z8G4_CAPAN|nr:hypothetical protein T459_16338 [Capsicum annuum]